MQLIQLLSDGKFHSGEELGDALSISRAAIWKQLKKLEKETGLTIQSVQGKGYRLESSLSLLNSQNISPFMSQWPIYLLNTTDSTNKQAFQLLTQNTSPPFAVTAEQQTDGRGRRGRRWISPFASNIYYSLLLRIDRGMQQLEGLSLTIGLAVLHTLKQYKLTNAGLKWPNDILINNQKIAGILLELQGDPADICHVVIGIGLNVNMQKTAEQTTLPWTSIYHQTGQIIDRNQLIITLSQSLDYYLTIHMQKSFTALKEEWEANNLWQNKEVNLLQGEQQISGRMIGIDNTGALKLQLHNEIKYFNAGEVSLRLAPSID